MVHLDSGSGGHFNASGPLSSAHVHFIQIHQTLYISCISSVMSNICTREARCVATSELRPTQTKHRFPAVRKLYSNVEWSHKVYDSLTIKSSDQSAGS